MPLIMRNTRITVRNADRCDYTVMSGGLPIGRLYEDFSTTNPDDRWLWSIFGVRAGPDVMCLKGNAPNLTTAEEQLRANWNKWLAWANLAELPTK